MPCCISVIYGSEAAVMIWLNLLSLLVKTLHFALSAVDFFLRWRERGFGSSRIGQDQDPVE